MSIHRETGSQVWWQGTIKETENEGGYFEKYPFLDWELVKLFERWFNMLMSAFAKNYFCCVILNILETVHLISSNVNEQRVAIVQTTENEGTIS